MSTASHVEFFVEEPSAKEALEILVPKIRADLGFNIYAYEGCPDLLKKLPERFRGYRSWLPSDWRIIVLIDRDRSDCIRRKHAIYEMAELAGLRVKARRSAAAQVIVRIAVEELESWFFGDIPALRAAYPGIPKDLGKKAPYRDPDAIRDTWEQLERELQQAGHFSGGLQKIRCARDIASHMNPDTNRSHSFTVFREALRGL